MVDLQPGGRTPSDERAALSTAAGSGAGAGPVRHGGYLRFWPALIWAGALILLVMALRNAPLEQIAAVLSRLGAWQIAVLVLVNGVIILLLNARWWLLLRSFGQPVPLMSLVAYRLAGSAVSYFTPGPQFGGEPLQVHLLHRRQSVPLTTAVSVVFFDRLVDLLANFTFLMIGCAVIILSNLAAGWFNGAIWAASFGLFAFPLLHLGALRQGRQPASWLIAWFAGRLTSWFLNRLPAGGLIAFLQKASEITGQSENQIAVLLRERPAVLLRMVGLSALVWSGMIFEYWLCLHFTGITANPVETLSALTAARLAFLLPFPAGLGALEASQSLAAQVLGWGAASGIALSLIIRARDITLALLGLWLGGSAYRSVLFRMFRFHQRR
jgi:glycosyltransferase 2 family protein